MARHRLRTILGTALGVVVAVLVGLGVGLGRVMGGVPDGPVSTCEQPLDWTRAGEVVGETAAVAGPVVSTAYEPDVGGAPTFINLGSAHPDPDRFDVVIYEEVREGFDEVPEDVFDGQVVCVRGHVRDRDGVPQIVLEAPTWIETHEGGQAATDRPSGRSS